MEKTPEPEMTKDEKKFLIRALWEALLAPGWTKDSLIDLGTAIFTKKTLKGMDDEIFNKIFPFLGTIAAKLWQLLGEEAARQTTASREKTEDGKLPTDICSRPGCKSPRSYNIHDPKRGGHVFVEQGAETTPAPAPAPTPVPTPTKEEIETEEKEPTP